jgi:5-methylcytosine-specific restriction enzyme subunit McrC
MYTYLRSQEHRSDKYRSSSGILLYPTVNQNVSEEVDLQGHKLMIRTVDLSRPWQEIATLLVDLIVKT